MAKISTALWFVIPTAHRLHRQTFIIKAANKDDALAHWNECDYSDIRQASGPVVPFDEWCEARDVIAANELHYMLGARDEQTVPLGFVKLAT